MRLPPLAWTVCFAVATVGCASAALAAGSTPVGTTITPLRNDVVVFVAPRATESCQLGQLATGIVAGIPGDTVAVRGKQVLVNGQALTAVPPLGVRTFEAQTVPPGGVFLLGTGAAAACDSRQLGAIPAANVVGYTQAGLDARVDVVQQQLNSRIRAEKYVAGVYFVVVAFFVLWLMIHTGKVSRLQRELAELQDDSRRANHPGV
jgi:signal peptidase I